MLYDQGGSLLWDDLFISLLQKNTSLALPYQRQSGCSNTSVDLSNIIHAAIPLILGLYVVLDGSTCNHSMPQRDEIGYPHYHGREVLQAAWGNEWPCSKAFFLTPWFLWSHCHIWRFVQVLGICSFRGQCNDFPWPNQSAFWSNRYLEDIWPDLNELKKSSICRTKVAVSSQTLCIILWETWWHLSGVLQERVSVVILTKCTRWMQQRKYIWI